MPTKHERIGVVCLPVRFELLYSTRDAEEYEVLDTRLAALRDITVTSSIQRGAMAAQRALARLGPLHHRVPLPDLLIAATAHEHGLVVLHEDHNFELLERVMSFSACRLLGDG
ncbi:MAG: PIN domain-containing protein [Solirubrobacteraceae bacterium]